MVPGTLSSTTLHRMVSSLLLAAVYLLLGSVSGPGAGHQVRGGGRASYGENLPTDQLYTNALLREYSPIVCMTTILLMVW